MELIHLIDAGSTLSAGVVHRQVHGPSTVYLLLAGACLLVALSYVRRSLAPIAAIVEAVTAAFFVVLAIAAALVLLAAAAVTSH